MKIWAKTTEFSEGKFLVTRRDGTTPSWPHFVIGARDPVAPKALHAYAKEAEDLGYDPEYCESVHDLAEDFSAYPGEHGLGDPDAPPHRTDLPLAIAIMRGMFSVADIAAALERIELAGAEGRGMAASAIARQLLDGRKPKAEPSP